MKAYNNFMTIIRGRNSKIGNFRNNATNITFGQIRSPENVQTKK